ncbi:MAG TPA: hypothetical protein VFC44_17275 [Candidatus Saccharimonadales bacterium]|nr:hypothetical protein [Candidatus Saccharimonadales bacterium]
MNTPGSQTTETIKHTPTPASAGVGESSTSATPAVPKCSGAGVPTETTLASPPAPNAATVQECEATKSSGTIFLHPIKWPAKAQFLHLLWDKPATHIAAELGCCQASVLARAKELNLPRPGHGYWQKKTAGIATIVSNDVKILMAKLDAESFVEPAFGPDSRRFKSSRRRYSGFRMFIAWPLKARFLRMLWTKPSVHIARELGCTNGAVTAHAKALGLPTPGNRYWQKKRAGHDIDIPDDVTALMAALEAKN